MRKDSCLISKTSRVEISYSITSTNLICTVNRPWNINHISNLSRNLAKCTNRSTNRFWSSVWINVRKWSQKVTNRTSTCSSNSKKNLIQRSPKEKVIWRRAYSNFATNLWFQPIRKPCVNLWWPHLANSKRTWTYSRSPCSNWAKYILRTVVTHGLGYGRKLWCN